MASVKSLDDIRKSLERDISMRKLGEEKVKIIIGMGECGVKAGAREVLDEVRKQVARCTIGNLVIALNDFYDQNNWAPVLWVEKAGKPISIHTNVEPSMVFDILKNDLGEENFQ